MTRSGAVRRQRVKHVEVRLCDGLDREVLADESLPGQADLSRRGTV
jgi:hypothetical protein